MTALKGRYLKPFSLKYLSILVFHSLGACFNSYNAFFNSCMRGVVRRTPPLRVHHSGMLTSHPSDVLAIHSAQLARSAAELSPFVLLGQTPHHSRSRPSRVIFFLYTHLTLIVLCPLGRSVISQVSFFSIAFISSSIATFHFGSRTASSNEIISTSASRHTRCTSPVVS
jgi:hypothetical protein